MGAQAAVLLDAASCGAPLGTLDPPWSPTGSVQLAVDGRFDLARTALAHAGVGLAPSGWDGQRLHLRLPGGPVAVDRDLTVTWRGAPPDVAVVRRVLALDDDLEPLWQACDAVEELAWVRSTGTGRVLRSPTVWQDVVGALAQVRSSYRGAQGRMRALVGDGPFPAPGDVAGRPQLTGWGLREPWLRALATAVDAGVVEPERWLGPRLDDDAVHEQLLALPGIGQFTAAQLMPLLGRPRPMVLDGWLRTQLGDASDAVLVARYAPAGRWAGTAAWLDVLAPRLGPG